MQDVIYRAFNIATFRKSYISYFIMILSTSQITLWEKKRRLNNNYSKYNTKQGLHIWYRKTGVRNQYLDLSIHNKGFRRNCILVLHNKVKMMIM